MGGFIGACQRPHPHMPGVGRRGSSSLVHGHGDHLSDVPSPEGIAEKYSAPAAAPNTGTSLPGALCAERPFVTSAYVAGHTGRTRGSVPNARGVQQGRRNNIPSAATERRRIYRFIVAEKARQCHGERRGTPQICAEWYFCAKNAACRKITLTRCIR